MSAPLQPTNTFCIEFNVDKKSGYIKATQITIEHTVMDSMDAARIDLADHPLYKSLQQYVLANPRKYK
jgi:hypothetical protein